MTKPESAPQEKPIRRYYDDPLLVEAMQALTHTPGRRWLRERGGFEPMHMDCRKATGERYKTLVSCVELAVKPRPSSD